MTKSSEHIGVFISYSHADRAIADDLSRRLAAEGYRIWLDRLELRAGDSLTEKIAAAIGDMEFLIALVTETSVNSPWCRKELSLAMTGGLNQERVKVLPIRVGGVAIPPGLQDVYCLPLDPTNPEAAVRKLVADIRSHHAERGDGESTNHLSPRAEATAPPRKTEILEEGTAVREKRDERVYIIVGGAKVWLPGPAWYERYDEPEITVLHEGSAATIPDIPRDGTLLRDWSESTIYFIEQGAPRALSHGEVDAIDPSLIKVVPDGAIAKITKCRESAHDFDEYAPELITAQPSDLRYEVVSVETFSDQAQIHQAAIQALRPGETILVVVKAKNIGSIPWRASGAAPAQLGTWRPQDHFGRFFTRGWVSPNRPATLSEAMVAPGDTGTFRFQVKAPNETGAWTEYFNLLLENWAWAPDEGIRVDIEVIEDRSNP